MAALDQFIQFLPTEGIKILLVLFLAFLIGLEREEHKTSEHFYYFGGVRTYPLIALIGYSIALLSKQLLPEILGFLVVGGFLMVSYWHKVTTRKEAEMPGMTSELSGLVTYLVGPLVYHDYFWIATTLTVASMLLLELKEALEGLTRRLAPHEILTFTKFLLLTAVILPVLPNQPFGPFLINPFKTWLVVVAVSSVSYASYILLQVTRGSGILLSAVLGGIYSSTATTVALAKRSNREEHHPHLFAGATLLASAFMYLRLTALIAIFNKNLVRLLAVPFLGLAAAAAIAGLLWARRRNGQPEELKREYQHENPLEMRVAFLFAGIFLIILVITKLALSYMGNKGAYILAAIIGFADVDPFIMSMTQAAGATAQLSVSAGAIVLAAASNNIAKGIYALSFGSRGAGGQSLLLLFLLALAGLLPLLWL